MFTAKFLKDGATLYRSRLTDFRYVISQTIHGLKFYINGMAIHVNASATRKDIFDAIEYHEAIYRR